MAAAVNTIPAIHAGAVVCVIGKLGAGAGVLAGVGVTGVLLCTALCTLVLLGAGALILSLRLFGAGAPILTRGAFASIHFSRAVISFPTGCACTSVDSNSRIAGGIVLARVRFTEIHLEVHEQ